ncbi:MAG: tetratricopeptide repeat protein, partial [Candidatus Rokubacteria bacterium]|nr:tetratricopeptide repeat protein [Candidatus Rokubacteria bacterium]
MRRARASVWAVALLVLSGAPAAAATVAPLEPPPPDLTRLVPFAEAPVEKPPVAVPEPALPPSPAALPPVPPAPVAAPPAVRPTAPLAPPGALPCVGAWLGIASKALECGRARFTRGEWDDAAQAFDQAVRGGKERELLAEARYWHAETLERLGRTEQADWLFRQVVQASGGRGDWVVWSRHASGWTALRLRDAARARDTFAPLLAAAMPASIQPWARHGLALAQYALGRYEDALATWEALVAAGPPPALARDVSFWLGDTRGRVGQPERAAAALAQFVQGGPHPLLDPGLVRLGWWSLAAGRAAESAAAFRTYLAPPASPAASPVKPEQDWAEAGLALALLPADVDGAQVLAQRLESRRSALITPLRVRLVRALVDAGKAAEARALAQELLGAALPPAARAYVLLLLGEAWRLEGNRDEARTQYDLARTGEGGVGWIATVRLARTNFEMREFAQAARDLGPVFAARVAPEVRAAALLLAGEAHYHAGDHAAAAASFRRLLVEFPDHAQAADARLGVAWSALRQDRRDEARREFLEFARVFAGHAYAPDALELAAEQSLRLDDDREAARKLLDGIVADHASHPRTEFARLNRAILMLRMGEARAAVPELRDWIARAPFPPLLGRAHAALGAALLATGAPAEAQRSFTLAQLEGVGPLAALGLGSVGLLQQQWDAAAGALTEARDGGTPAVAAAAEYGLAVVAFHKGARADFKTPALAALAADPKGPGAPRLFYALVGVAVEARDWPGALDLARRLITEFPADGAADDALERVGSAAAAVPAWPVVYEAYALLARTYPTSPFAGAARLTLAEAQLETGRAEAAKPALEQLVAAAPDGPEAPRAWAMLARAREATGDRPGALEAYARAAKDGTALRPAAAFGYGRLLVDDKRW